MSNPFVAEIRIFAGNFAPTQWARCDGQLLPISQNTALFSLLGTTYGGDGKSTFALPDFQGRAPIHRGSSPFGNYDLGEIAGEDSLTLLTTEMPAHGHGLMARPVVANIFTPDATSAIAKPDPATNLLYKTSAALNAQLFPISTSVAGGSLPHNNMQPYLVLMFIIALQGVFPARG